MRCYGSGDPRNVRIEAMKPDSTADPCICDSSIALAATRSSTMKTIALPGETVPYLMDVLQSAYISHDMHSQGAIPNMKQSAASRIAASRSNPQRTAIKTHDKHQPKIQHSRWRPGLQEQCLARGFCKFCHIARHIDGSDRQQQRSHL